MLQILGLRTFEKDGKTHRYDAFFDRHWRAPTLEDLFANIDEYLKLIPQDERRNIFFTPNNCTAKKREFQSASSIFFDVDKIDVERVPEYIELFCKTLNVKPEQTATVFSGRGLHFYIGLLTPIVDKEFYRNFRDHYKAILSQVAKAYKEAGLPHEVDPAVFDARRLMRLPGTINHKPEKGADVECRLLQPKIIPINFDITLASGIPQVRKDEQIDKDYFKRFPKTDNAAVMEGCDFIKWAKEKPNEVQEPQWYALLSIVARMEDGQALAHEISKGHQLYSPGETDLKINQAMSASGPRTCASINQSWGKCHQCPNFQKVNSPIMLRSAETIGTEHTGFHDVVYDPETGKMKLGKPNYADLLKFFERQYKFVSHDKFCWIYKGTHWVEIKNEELENFAQTHFKPHALSNMVEEFRKLVHRSNLVDPKEWAGNTTRRVNFRNGVLELDSMEFGPHSPDYGFKYVLPYDYDPQAQAPRFEKFLSQVTGGSPILIDTLKEFAGYSLSGDECRYQKALILDGEGSNGKSTFIEVLKAVAGQGSYTTLSFNEMNNPDRRSALDGILFNITEETPNKIMDTTTFKNIVSGGEVTARKLYKNLYTMRSRAKLIFSCNELPTTNDTTHGYHRRSLIVKFDQKFSKELGNIDKNIQDALMQELPGIFNIFIRGYHALRQRGEFAKETIKDRDVEEYAIINDPILDWFKNEVQILPVNTEKRTTLKDLYRSFKLYCEDYGDRYSILRKSVFEKRLQKVIPQYKERCVRGYEKEGDKVERPRALLGIVADVGEGNF